MDELDVYAPVYALVRAVPAGKVVTYGQAAGLITEFSLTARQVGSAMRYAPKGVPWQRVVGAGGALPIAKLSPELHRRQRELLEAEGVTFRNESDRVDMARHQWQAAGGGTGELFANAADADERETD